MIKEGAKILAVDMSETPTLRDPYYVRIGTCGYAQSFDYEIPNPLTSLFAHQTGAGTIWASRPI